MCLYNIIFRKERNNAKKVLQCEIEFTSSILNNELDKEFRDYRKINELQANLQNLNSNLKYLSKL